MKKYIAKIATLTGSILKVQEKIYGKPISGETLEGLQLANRIENEQVRSVLEGMISIFNQHPILLTKITDETIEDLIRTALKDAVGEISAQATQMTQMEQEAKKLQDDNDRLMTELFEVSKSEQAALGTVDKLNAALDQAMREKDEAADILARLQEPVAEAKAEAKAEGAEESKGAPVTAEPKSGPSAIVDAKATSAPAQEKAPDAELLAKQDLAAAQAKAAGALSKEAQDKLAKVSLERDEALAKAAGADAKLVAATTEKDAAIAAATQALEEKEAALKVARDALAAAQASEAKAESTKSVSDAARGALEKEIQKKEKALTLAQDLTRQKDAELKEAMSKIGLERAEEKVKATQEAVIEAEKAEDLVGRAVAQTRDVKSELEVQIKEKEEAKAAAQRAETLAKDALDAARAATIEVGVARGERNAAVAKVENVKHKIKGIFLKLESEIRVALAAQAGAQAQNIQLLTKLSEITQRNIELERLNDKLTGQLAAIQIGKVPEVTKLLQLLHTTNDEKDKEQRKEITKLKGVVEAVGRIVSTRQSSQTRDVEHLMKEIDVILTQRTP